MSAIILEDAAREDLIDIWQYIAQDNPQAADRMLDRIWDGFCVVAGLRSRVFYMERVTWMPSSSSKSCAQLTAEDQACSRS